MVRLDNITMECFQFDGGSSGTLLCDLSDDPFASQFRRWSDGRELVLSSTATNDTHFGYVYEGAINLVCDSGSFMVSAGMYFSVPGAMHITPVVSEDSSETSKGIVITRNNFYGMFQLGGPVESTGRLRYIDGCTDSLLISPVVLGDPCLNLLHIPPGTQQTAHTHPSLRLGMIVSGSGTCVTPSEDFHLESGTLFYIPSDDQHSFHTDDDESLRVIAYHPESDFGPDHEDHPMINKTIID